MAVRCEARGDVAVVIVDNPRTRNAVDGPTARALAAAMRSFDADPGRHVAVLWGAGGTFSSGADLGTIAAGDGERGLRVAEDGDGPLGVTRMLLGKPVIAAIEGHAVAGGLELALWCDLRVAAEDATLGVFCRRFGVPLVDGGTVRLPRIVGLGRALDMILTGRGVGGREALAIGLVDRLVPSGTSLDAALELAAELSRLPQTCLRSDRLSAHEQWGLPAAQAMRNETRRGLGVLASGESLAGAERFAGGEGRHGRPAADHAR